jgi:hypothetical protein
LQRKLLLLEEQNRRMQDVVNRQLKEYVSVRQELERLYRSRSWLITKPLRAINGLRQRIISGEPH